MKYAELDDEKQNSYIATANFYYFWKPHILNNLAFHQYAFNIFRIYSNHSNYI